MIIELGHTSDKLPPHACTHCGRRIDLILIDSTYLRHRIDNETNNLPIYLDNDNPGRTIMSGFGHSETAPEIHYGDHLSPQIQDPFDEIRELRDTSQRFVPDNLLDAENRYPVFFASQRETDELTEAFVLVAGFHHGSTSFAFLFCTTSSPGTALIIRNVFTETHLIELKPVRM